MATPTDVNDSSDTRKKFTKRDTLQSLEAEAQKYWEENKFFEINAPLENEKKDEKFMGTFPFPYMNGRLHLGHSFSLSKLEFAVGYERLKGKRALFPFGFHCTGMPIKACADKLAREVEMFGKQFENYSAIEEMDKLSIDDKPDKSTPNGASADSAKVIKKAAKVTAKSTGLKYQFQIMESMGVPKNEIHKFADAKHWLYYFPPFAQADLRSFGAKIDWRRSFITTDVNPYYDSFIRWQFNKLKALNKIKYGERYSIYSVLDGQACMDHDRAQGEGVGVQEYTGIKLEVIMSDILKTDSEKDKVKGIPVGQKLASKEIQNALNGRKLFMVAATLRPETMYGQTNCFVGVDIEYHIYVANDSEAWIVSKRAATNMAYQGCFTSLKRGELVLLGTLKGWDLIGVPVKAPLSPFDKVYTLPMEGVLESKGTGVVTSVPSDSPDDYITLSDLSKKAAYYNVQPHWVNPFLPPRPIIRTPNLGDVAAVTAVTKRKIQSQKDKVQLKEAKEEVYKEGFYSGVLLVGDHAGKPVQEVKKIIQEELIKIGSAIKYCEPENLVVSRSGDECIVSLMDQWYLDYGEPSWKKDAEECLAQLNTYCADTRNAFQKNLDWLHEWACSRSFGLGSRLPWDPQYLIESLSDSTIYMAYYTVAHLLQQGALDGSIQGPAKIPASEMTDEVWNYILIDDSPLPKSTTIPLETLNSLKREFQYFYPVDLRVSGKDLIGNHLTFFIYNHVAIFPRSQWPKAIRANGHLMLNSDKMSKSTGNFVTLSDAVQEWGADATRFTLADAGDSLEDANCLSDTANSIILRLFTQKEWVEEMAVEYHAGKLRTGPYNWHDEVFAAEMDKLVELTDKSYSNMLYREAAKTGFYEFQKARDNYREACATVALHQDLVLRFIEWQALIISPFIPHWCEHVWRNVLKKPGSIVNARWPVAGTPSESLLAAAGHIREVLHRIRSTEDAAAKKANKKGKVSKGASNENIPNGGSSNGCKIARIYVASTFPSWQEDVVAMLKQGWDSNKNAFNGKEMALLGSKGLLKDKKVMPFVSNLKKLVENNGYKAFDRSLLFNELETLKSNVDTLQRGLEVTSVEILKSEDVLSGIFDEEDKKKAETAVPGNPTYRIWIQ